MSNIRETLVSNNPWWKGPFSIEYKERSIYAHLQKFLPMRQMVALTGLRRVGKTTLLLKIAHDAIRSGADPRRVVYFPFDEFRRVSLRDVVGEAEQVLEQDLRRGPAIVLLDEVQKVDGWDDQAKALYDACPKLKFILSGSESLFIRGKSRETLAGRLFDFRVEPLTFAEYVVAKGVDVKPIGLHEKELAALFDEYVPTQGFPEMVGVRDRDILRKYLRDSIVEKVVYRDLPTLVPIREPAALMSLLNILMEEPGQLIQISELCHDLGVSRQTLSTYLTYLEEAFLVRKLYNYSGGRRKVERKLRRYYPTVVSVDLLFRADDTSRGRAFEWAVVNSLRPEYFWRDPYQHEVDVVLDRNPPLPVEIKSGRVDTSGVEAFMRKFRAPRGIVVTRREEGSRATPSGPVELVPAFKFLLRPSPR